MTTSRSRRTSLEGRGPQLAPDEAAYWATELPLLDPRTLLPRCGTQSSAFPFDQPNVQYVHFARNAIYHLAQQMGLTGAEVLMPAYFHGVELEALLAAGVKPRFYDVHQGMRVYAEDIERSVTRQTRAIYLIHYAGLPGPAEAVQAICRDRGLLFIEDCALALLSKAGTRPLGSFGDAAVFCVYKTLPTPDGGAVVWKHGRLRIHGAEPSLLGTVQQAAASVLNQVEHSGGRAARSFARALKVAGKAAVQARKPQWVAVGTQQFKLDEVNLLMSGLSRRIAAAQDFSAIVETRRRNYAQLQSLLSDLSPPVLGDLPEGMCPLFYPFATERKYELWTRLRAEGIQSVLFWLKGELGPQVGEFPEVDALRRTVLELPCHQGLTPQAIERVAHTVRKALHDLAQ